MSTRIGRLTAFVEARLRRLLADLAPWQNGPVASGADSLNNQYRWEAVPRVVDLSRCFGRSTFYGLVPPRSVERRRSKVLVELFLTRVVDDLRRSNGFVEAEAEEGGGIPALL